MLILQHILGRLGICQPSHDHVGLYGVARKVARTHLGAAGALDAAHFGPLQGNRYRNIMLFYQGSIISHNDITGCCFCDSQTSGFFHIITFSHHGSSGNYVIGRKRTSSCQGKALCKGRSQGGADNAWGFDGACDSQVFISKGLPLGSIENGVDCGQIGDNGSHIKGDSGGRNRTARDIADHDLLIAGRIKVFYPVKPDRTAKVFDSGLQGSNFL